MQHDYFQLLIQSAQKGRKNAFIDLCELNTKKIYTLCVRMLANKKVASKITIQIFLQAWENIQFVRTDTPFELWLKSIAIYALLEEIRTKTVTTSIEFDKEDTNITTDNKLDELLVNLPEKERIIFLLRESEGYTFDEIKDFFNEYALEEIKLLFGETRRKILEAMKDEL